MVVFNAFGVLSIDKIRLMNSAKVMFFEQIFVILQSFCDKKWFVVFEKNHGIIHIGLAINDFTDVEIEYL